jgi:hypothetical protein
MGLLYNDNLVILVSYGEITQQIREVAAGVVKTIISNINIQVATLEAA